ncbi:MAG: type IV secretory system conjugative DNA transfer family protein [Eubacteriales bacterium]|nr:type IV secretory system conjugative DNA transfer family protein [Eubacteriales bacterium]
MENPFSIKWTENTTRTILIFTLAYGLGIGIYYSTRKNKRPLEEHGSASWADPVKLGKKYSSKNLADNILLTENFKISFDSYKHRRNLNVLVIGGSGSGKTRFYAKPNIMQCNCSFLITDPKAELLRSTGHLLRENGYDVRVFDLINMSESYCYNPFRYIRDDKDVLKLVTNLIRNTTPKTAGNIDPFWEKSETALLQALILYLYHEAPEEEQNFTMVMEMLSSAEVREEDESFASPLDLLFERLNMTDPEHIAVKQYGIYKQAAGKTAKSILISVGVRLAAFNLKQIASITQYDEMDLESLGTSKTALFCVIPDNDSSFNYLIGMLYTQAFQSLYYLADHHYGGRLPMHVHAVMDEFANIALPDDFDKLLSTMRSREISVSIIIQNMAQLKALFKDSWESIVGNCDELLYLGGNEQSTHEYISKLLGKATIDTNTYGKSQGRSGSYSTNYQQSGRELLMPDEVRLLNNADALLFVRGERAMHDRKIDLLKHRNIHLTTDGGYTPYTSTNTNMQVPDINYDPARHSDYDLLTEEDLIDPSESKKPIYYEITEEN